jgi:hypothetical protein
MPKRFLSVALLGAALTGTLPAQSAPALAKVAGTWSVAFTSPQGNANWTVKLQQVVDTLRGTASTDFGELTVEYGWVEGSNMGFTLNLNYNGTPITLNFAGAVKNDTVTGKIEIPGVNIDPMPFTAVRASGSSSPQSSTGAAAGRRRDAIARASVSVPWSARKLPA